MARKSLPILLIIALGLAALLFLMQSPPSAPQAPDHAPTREQPPAAPAAAPTATSEPAEVAAAGTLDRITLDLPPSGPSATLGTPVSEGGILVSVVDGESGVPLPRAEIMAIDEALVDRSEIQLQLSTTPDFEALFLKLGVLYHCDEQGQVRIPQPGAGLILAGRTPTHFNFAFNIKRDDEEVTLRLNPVQLLAVQVVDSAGRPIEGAPVCLRMRNDFLSQDLMSVRSGQDGLARLKLFDLLRTVLKDNEVFAALQVLTPEPIEARFDLDQLPAEPLRLVLPPLGQVEVAILQPDGRPATETFMVNLSLADQNRQEPMKADSQEAVKEAENLTVSGQDGHAFFPLVAFGTHLKVRVVSLDGERRAEAEGPGPVVGGAKVLFTLTPTVARPVLIGRILNAEGMVGKNLLLETRLRVSSANGNSTHSDRLRTDEDGRFRLLLDDSYLPGSTRQLTIIMKATKRKPQRMVKVDLSKPYGPGEHMLGDLVVTIPPLIAEGIVLDPDGAPVYQATVTPEVRQSYGDGSTEFYWIGQWEMRTETNREGHFQIHADLDLHELRLQASHPDYHPADPLEIIPGQAGIELRLRRSTGLKARLLLDEDISTDGLTVQLEQSNATGSGIEVRQAKLNADGSFEFNAVEPRVSRLKVSASLSDEILYDQPGIDLGTANGVLELPDIDLRGRLKAITVAVLDAETGARMKHLMLQFPDEEVQWGNFRSPLKFVTSRNSLTVRILATGYRTISLERVSADQQLEMQAGLPIEVVVDNIHELPPGWRLVAHLSLVSEELGEEDPTIMSWGLSDEITIDEQGHGRTELGSPGRYRYLFSISQLDADGHLTMPTHGVPQFSDPQFEVADIPGRQTLHLRLPADSLATLIADILANEAGDD